MLNQRVLACAIVVSAVLGLSACKSKPHAVLSGLKPNQMQFANAKAPESPDEKSCWVFVQKFYDWRVFLTFNEFCTASKRVNASNGALKNNQAVKDIEQRECKVAFAYRNAERLNLNQVLRPKLLRYFEREETVQAKEEDPGLDFDPYLNTQDPSPKFVVDNVRVNGNRCDAIVHGYDQGEQREEVMPQLSKTNGHWIIANFHYKFDQGDGKPPQNYDLIHMIREYLGELKDTAQ
jgi:hypothetical protein